MSGFGWAIAIVLGLLALAAAFVVLAYNRLVRLRQNVREAWSAIETELQRRHDLVPALVETVRGYAGHERQTLERVIAARGAAAAGRGPDLGHQRHESELVAALRQLLAVVEAYPELKASERFRQLQDELVETENRLSKARRFYNANVRQLNTTVQTIPWSLIAGAMRFAPEPYFEVEEAARATPQVQLSS